MEYINYQNVIKMQITEAAQEGRRMSLVMHNVHCKNRTNVINGRLSIENSRLDTSLLAE